MLKDVIGLKAGRLTIIERVGKNKHNQYLLKCLCDCGNYIIIPYSNFFRNDGKQTGSCGCYSKEQHLSKQVWEVEYRRYISSNAQRRNLIFEISFQDFKKLVNNNCHYCDASPSIKTHVGLEYRNSIDRLDSSIGYILDNCVSCCKICQELKMSLDYKDFIEQINKIYNFQNR